MLDFDFWFHKYLNQRILNQVKQKIEIISFFFFCKLHKPKIKTYEWNHWFFRLSSTHS